MRRLHRYPVARVALGLCIFVATLAAFRLVPAAAGFDDSATVNWGLTFQVGGTLLAALLCFVVAARSGAASDSKAWTKFGIAALFYATGNLLYVLVAVTGWTARFPTWPELAFFVMALLFGSGMMSFGRVRRRLRRSDLYNYALVFSGLAVACLFVLETAIEDSTLPPFGTFVAFAYPALWFSVAAACLVTLLLYDLRRRTYPFLLLTIAFCAEAGADFLYAFHLMRGTYVIGGTTQLLWVASVLLIIWAALEQLAVTAGAPAILAQSRPSTKRVEAQAAVPALAIGVALMAGAATGTTAGWGFSLPAAGLLLLFSAIAAYRERWLFGVQRHLRHQAERSERQLRAVFGSMSDSVTVIDKDWRITFYNDSAADIMQVRPGEAIGDDIRERFREELESTRTPDALGHVMATRKSIRYEDFIASRDIWLELRAYPTAEGGISIFYRDITEDRRAREELAFLAHHDALTGLMNRTSFQVHVQRALAEGERVAVILLDLDHFKEINDTLGHRVGDAVLVDTATRLRACLRPGDPLARLGGDEFAALVAGPESEAALTGIARRMIDAVTEPHQLDGMPVRLRATIGIAVRAPGDTADQMFRNADVALDVAKAEGRGAIRIFEPAMGAGRRERQALRTDLIAALEAGQFELVYQPVLDLANNSICSFEALLRWRHPQRGMVSPAVFVPMAEETGLIEAIGGWALRQACRQAMSWPEHVSVAVNLSSRQFAGGGLTRTVAAVLADSGLPARRLELEITESVLLNDSRANLHTLGELRQLGVSIALDDFGTGYSSLSYLQSFPFSKIKIDRAFVAGLPGSTESQAIVRSVVGLGHALGMRITAEGVEKQEQLDWLRAGCDEAQGYLISPPVPPDEVARLLAGSPPPVRSRPAQETSAQDKSPRLPGSSLRH